MNVTIQTDVSVNPKEVMDLLSEQEKMDLMPGTKNTIENIACHIRMGHAALVEKLIEELIYDWTGEHLCS